MTMSCRCLTTNYIDWIATDMVVVLCYMHIALCHARCYYKVVHLIWNSLPYQFQQHLSVTSFVSAFFIVPSSPVSIFDNLCITLQMINPAYFSTFLLLGDFNIDFCNPQHFMFSHLNNILCSFSLTQVVPSFTHVSPSGSKSLIDLALLADKSHLQSCSSYAGRKLFGFCEQ